jgi:hypothetical protein
MTRRASTYALKLTLTLALLVGAALLVGLRQPPSDWAKLLRLDECQLPCWIGIEPGVTTLADGERRIERAFQDDALYKLEKYGSGGYDIIHTPTGFGLRTNFISGTGLEGSNAPVIYTINLMPHTLTTYYGARPGIAELYAGLGEIEGLQRVVGWETFQLNLFFKARMVDVYFDEPMCDEVQVNQAISSISISAQPPSSTVGVLSPPSPWRGFNQCHDLELQIHR